LRFTVRRPADAEVSPCCHRPSGGDVACCVEVGVARSCGAGLALEHRLALAVSGSDIPAHRATLRRVGGRDLLDPTMGFVLQSRGEQTPTAAADAPVKPAFLSNSVSGLLDSSARAARHGPHIEGFDANRVEPARDIGGQLLDPILSPGGLFGLQFGDRQLRASAPLRSASGAGQPLLQQSQSRRLTAGQAGHIEHFPGGQGCRYRDTAVDTDHRAITGASDRRRCVGKGQMPTPGPITGNPIRLHTVRHRARAAKPHPANLGHPHPPETPIEPLDVTHLDRHLPEPLVHTGFAPRRAPVRATEEITHRLREIPQRLLLHGLRTGRQPLVLGTRGRQLDALLVVARRATARLPKLLLLDRQIPHVPGMAAMLSQRCHLLSSRKQPISRHTQNLSPTTDTTQKGEAALPPRVKARGFHAAPNR
jgi:hypothetical protein